MYNSCLTFSPLYYIPPSSYTDGLVQTPPVIRYLTQVYTRTHPHGVPRVSSQGPAKYWKHYRLTDLIFGTPPRCHTITLHGGT